MEKPTIKNQEIPSQSVEEITKQFTQGDLNENQVIDYLRANRNDVTEFCLQTFEAYQSGDKTGIIKLGMIIEELL